MLSSEAGGKDDFQGLLVKSGGSKRLNLHHGVWPPDASHHRNCLIHFYEAGDPKLNLKSFSHYDWEGGQPNPYTPVLLGFCVRSDSKTWDIGSCSACCAAWSQAQVHHILLFPVPPLIYCLLWLHDHWPNKDP